ncbi:MAG: acyl-CoA thioesterase [Chloroflexi bacterium]|nr:acyl-CoA thioesterase [Chloroflexota bacterium]
MNPSPYGVPSGESPRPSPTIQPVTERANPDELTLAQVMLPEDANPRGNVHGGTLMKLADTAGGVCATRHTRRRVVTVVMDSMTFEQPVYVGDLVIVHAQVTWTGRTSIETEVRIDVEHVLSGEMRHISTAYFVYVATDEHGRPTPVHPFEAITPEQRQRWQAAEERRAARMRQRLVGASA